MIGSFPSLHFQSTCFFLIGAVTKLLFKAEKPGMKNIWIEVYYFISHEEETLLFSKSDHFFNALPALDLTYHTGQPEFDQVSQVCTWRPAKFPHLFHHSKRKHYCRSYRWGFRGWWCRGRGDCSAAWLLWWISGALRYPGSNSCLRLGSSWSAPRPGRPERRSTEGTGGRISSLLCGYDLRHTLSISEWSGLGRVEGEVERGWNEEQTI